MNYVRPISSIIMRVYVNEGPLFTLIITPQTGITGYTAKLIYCKGWALQECHSYQCARVKPKKNQRSCKVNLVCYFSSITSIVFANKVNTFYYLLSPILILFLPGSNLHNSDFCLHLFYRQGSAVNVRRGLDCMLFTSSRNYDKPLCLHPYFIQTYIGR